MKTHRNNSQVAQKLSQQHVLNCPSLPSLAILDFYIRKLRSLGQLFFCDSLSCRLEDGGWRDLSLGCALLCFQDPKSRSLWLCPHQDIQLGKTGFLFLQVGSGMHSLASLGLRLHFVARSSLRITYNSQSLFPGLFQKVFSIIYVIVWTFSKDLVTRSGGFVWLGQTHQDILSFY